MITIRKQIEVYISSEAEKDLKSQSKVVNANFIMLFALLRQGRQLSKKNFKKLSNTQIWEFRVADNGVMYRALGSFFEISFIVVSVFKKKSQKTPLMEIKKASKRLNYYFKNHE